MNARRPPARPPRCLKAFLVHASFVAALAALPGGCLVYEVASVPVKVAEKTVVVAGKATGAIVKTTGKVAGHAIGGDSASDTSLDACAKLAHSGSVTFVDVPTGTFVRMPWKRGLSLTDAGNLAHLDLAARTVQLLRDREVVYTAAGKSAKATLRSGDVVRLID